MLRVFSNQLRRIGKMERSVLGESEIVNPDAELFKIGEYYYKAGVFEHAQYAFKRYMEYYPDGGIRLPAMKTDQGHRCRRGGAGRHRFQRCRRVEEGVPQAEETSAAGGGMDDFNDFSIDDKGGRLHGRFRREVR